MKFNDLAKNRFSCRSYTNKKVENDKLVQIIDTARIAPSANNKQPWYFIVVQEDKTLLNKVYKTYAREWLQTAPAIIIAFANKNEAWVRKTDQKNHSEIDAAIAIDHITLAATDTGLTTCWICNFDTQAIINIFNLSPEYVPIALIPIGYCDKKPNLNRFENKRKKIEEIAKFI